MRNRSKTKFLFFKKEKTEEKSVVRRLSYSVRLSGKCKKPGAADVGDAPSTIIVLLSTIGYESAPVISLGSQ